MNRAECEHLIDEYLAWLRQGLHVKECDDACQVTTPFLDRHNDAIEIFVEKHNGSLRFTDDGYTVRDLRASGLEFTTEKRKHHLTAILNGFGVHIKDDELFVLGTPTDFPQKKHSLVQAMLAVNDMFVMGEEHVLSLFKEDVAAFLTQNQVPVFEDLKLSGRSGLDHKFDFAIPKTQTKPQRVLQAINRLDKTTATTFAFSVADVRVFRTEGLGAMAMINDTTQVPSEEYLEVLNAYEISPLLWSQRQEAVATLNGRG